MISAILSVFARLSQLPLGWVFPLTLAVLFLLAVSGIVASCLNYGAGCAVRRGSAVVDLASRRKQLEAASGVKR